MRIALLAPLVSPIAPPYLGGAQVVVAELAAGLARRGHAVTLYAAPGSAVPGVAISAVDVRPDEVTAARFAGPGAGAEVLHDDADPDDEEDLLRPDPAMHSAAYAYLRAYRQIAAHLGEHDLVHAHAYDWGAVAYSTAQPLPVMHTLHLPAVDAHLNALLGVVAPPTPGNAGPQRGPASVTARLATVSHACAATYEGVCAITDVIYNGVDLERIKFVAHADSADPYLLFAGRLSPEKGPADAVRIARRAGMRLVLVGDVYDEDYYAQTLAPLLSGESEVQRMPAVSQVELWRLMGGATAVLCPIAWEEPFGLVACEAQAAGTPVIAYRRGALPEVLSDGRSGCLVPAGDISAAAVAVERARTLDRSRCRAHIERQFSLSTMLDRYEHVYCSMLAESGDELASPLTGADS